MPNDAPNKAPQGFAISMDGKRTIPLTELDRLFDEGSDAIDDFIDWEKTELLEPASTALEIAFPSSVWVGLEQEATRVGLTPAALVKVWVAERLDRVTPQTT